MNHLSIRFLIGLSKSTDRPALFADNPNWIGYSERADTALAILGQRYNSFSSWRGVGHWISEREPTLTVEVVLLIDRPEYRERAQEIAGEIALALSQQAVAVAFAPVDFLLGSPEGTST